MGKYLGELKQRVHKIYVCHFLYYNSYTSARHHTERIASPLPQSPVNANNSGRPIKYSMGAFLINYYHAMRETGIKCVFVWDFGDGDPPHLHFYFRPMDHFDSRDFLRIFAAISFPGHHFGHPALEIRRKKSGRSEVIFKEDILIRY